MLSIVWIVNIFEIIAYASRAFALYYALQAAIGARRTMPRTGYAALALLGLTITLLGRSAE